MNKLNTLGISLLVASLSMFTAIETISANDMNIVSIKNIAHWDHLNIREEANASSEIIGKIPSNGEGIVLLGKERKIGKTIWVNITWGSVKGWVNANYLNFLSTDTVAWDKYKNDHKVAKEPKEPIQTVKSITLAKEQYGTAAEFREKISEYRAQAKAEKELAQLELAKQELAKQSAQSTSKQNSSSKKDDDEDVIVLKCGGVKPFWNIDLTHDDIQINIDKTRDELPITSRRKSSFYEKSVVIQGYGAQQENGVKLYLSKDNQCKDGITKIRYPYSVKAILNGDKVYYGCCDAVQ